MFETPWRRVDGRLLLCSLETSSQRSIKLHGDVLPTRIGNVPPRCCWVFETYLRCCWDVQRNVAKTLPRRLVVGCKSPPIIYCYFPGGIYISLDTVFGSGICVNSLVSLWLFFEAAFVIFSAILFQTRSLAASAGFKMSSMMQP